MLFGFEGAIKGLLALGIAFTIVTSAPAVLVNITNRGTIDLDTFVPRTAVSSPQSGKLQVEGTASERAAVRHALDDLVYPVDTSGFKVVVTTAENLPENAAGMYIYPENVIYLHEDVVRDPRRQGLSHVLAHEIGHMFDMVYMDESARVEFLKMRSFPPGTSWRSSDADWASRPEEDFAEVFAVLDAPSAGTPVQTDAGRIKNIAQARRLVERFQPGPSRTTKRLQVATMLSLARTAANDMRTEPQMLPVMFILMLVVATVSAVQSMEEMR